jgi:ATP-binding cassette subfamily C protein LapB
VVTLTSSIDLPFVVLMLVVIGLLRRLVGGDPLLAFSADDHPVMIIQVRLLRDTVQKLEPEPERQAFAGSRPRWPETLKACSAESASNKWNLMAPPLPASTAMRAQSRRWPPTAHCSSSSSWDGDDCCSYSIIAGNLSVGALVATYMLGGSRAFRNRWGRLPG